MTVRFRWLVASYAAAFAPLLAAEARTQQPGVPGPGAPAPLVAEPRMIKALDPAPTVFKDVNVVTMTSAGTLEHRSVLVRDGRIEKITPTGKLNAPKEA